MTLVRLGGGLHGPATGTGARAFGVGTGAPGVRRARASAERWPRALLWMRRGRRAVARDPAERPRAPAGGAGAARTAGGGATGKGEESAGRPSGSTVPPSSGSRSSCGRWRRWTGPGGAASCPACPVGPAGRARPAPATRASQPRRASRPLASASRRGRRSSPTRRGFPAGWGAEVREGLARAGRRRSAGRLAAGALGAAAAVRAGVSSRVVTAGTTLLEAGV